MRIVVDENIAFAREAFSQFGQVELFPGRKITSATVKDANALIVRSITEVNKKLLENSKVKFVGTATIGLDHIDTDYLKENEICFSSAAGCNSYAVTEYILTILFYFASRKNFSLQDKSIGIIGCGNIGNKVEKFANALGMKVLVNDPPLEKENPNKNYCSLEKALQADFITFHVPLNLEGEFKTFHILNEQNIDLIKNDAVLINSSRGVVVDNEIILERLKKKNNLNVVLDVWENEPDLNIDLLNRTSLATPHIAGYTLEGKVNGTLMVYRSLCKFLNEEATWIPALPFAEKPHHVLNNELDFESAINNILKEIYSIECDTNELKNYNSNSSQSMAKYFDGLRKNYNLRREFTNYTAKLIDGNPEIEAILKTLRFETTK